MKKGILIVLLLLCFPCIIFGSCNNDEYNKGKESARNITYSKDYSTSTMKFNVVFDNVENNIYAKYNKVVYKPQNGEVKINNISEGSNISVDFYMNGCDTQIDIIKISFPYYNTFYNSDICSKYVDVLTMCNSRFTTVKVTKETLELAIDNYNNMKIDIPKEEEKVVIEESFVDKVVNFSKEWGIKIIIVIATSLIGIVIGSVLYRKEVHGV